MANTWRAVSTAVAYAANKHMLDVFNGASSARYLRIYRMYLFNNHTGAVTGVLNFVQIMRNTAASGGSSVTPVAHDPNNTALDANSTAGTNRTISTSATLRRVLMSMDEVTVTTMDMDALFTLVPFAEIWNAGYADSNVQPLTAPSGSAYGYSIQSITATVGTADLEIEFTDAGS